jgi:hypothetical protein
LSKNFNKTITKSITKNKLTLYIKFDESKPETRIKIFNDQPVNNIIEKYCELQNIKSDNLYLTKSDYTKIDNNLTINKTNIENCETLYIFEENGQKNKRINFFINYKGKIFSFSGDNNDIFKDCIKNFYDIYGNKETILFILDNKIIEHNNSLKKIGLQNGDILKVGELK